MEINLEKIELVKDRTGCTYAEAKEALEKAEGSVVDAIIAVEESMNKNYAYAAGKPFRENPLFIKMKKIIDKGNVSKILVKKDEKVIVNFPLTAGVIGAVLVPWGAILGVVAALGTKCSIDFVTDKGEFVDINGKVVGAYDKAKEVAQKGVDKINDFEKSGKIDEIMDSIEKTAKTAADKVKSIVDDVAEKCKPNEGEGEAVDAEAEEFKFAAEEEFKNEEEL
ncbi:MAG: DUF4342 domain-containing protein [Mogibacterium sp.]|nr:DUF4342 domain-containing protein [Mogibacterium sp.]